MNKTTRICVMASGEGSNLQSIIDAMKTTGLGAGKVVLVLSDNPEARALVRAKIEKIPYKIIEVIGKTSEEIDRQILKYLKSFEIDLVCMAGYMRILGLTVVELYSNRIMNIHPSLLPAFKGLDAVGQALKYGVKVTGCTVHFVGVEDFKYEKPYDVGLIILQKSIEINNDDTHETLLQKIHEIEHELYPEAITLFCQNRLKIEGRNVKRINLKCLNCGKEINNKNIKIELCRKCFGEVGI